MVSLVDIKAIYYQREREILKSFLSGFDTLNLISPRFDFQSRDVQFIEMIISDFGAQISIAASQRPSDGIDVNGGGHAAGTIISKSHVNENQVDTKACDDY